MCYLRRLASQPTTASTVKISCKLGFKLFCIMTSLTYSNKLSGGMSLESASVSIKFCFNPVTGKRFAFKPAFSSTTV